MPQKTYIMEGDYLLFASMLNTFRTHLAYLLGQIAQNEKSLMSLRLIL